MITYAAYIITNMIFVYWLWGWGSKTGITSGPAWGFYLAGFTAINISYGMFWAFSTVGKMMFI